MDNNKNLFGLVLLLVLAVFISFTSVKTEKIQEITPDELHQKVIQNTRYFTPEQVAEKIISGDPALMLIDVRNEKYYNKFTLKGALNMPLNDILKKENLEYFDQDVYDVILFSNGSSDADAAWMLVTRLGYKNVYVMKGGLNAWVSRILQPKEHSVIWDRIDDEMYQYRRGASEYFGGKSSTPADDSPAPKPKKAVKRHKKKEVEGGCG
jgi:rhodanese-related sulfurtransferase